VTVMSFLSLAVSESRASFEPLHREEGAEASPPPVPASKKTGAGREDRARIEDAAYARGLAEGGQRAARQWQEKLARLEAEKKAWMEELTKKVSEEVDRFLAELEERSLRLALAVAEKILGREIAVDRAALTSRLARALASCGKAPGITVRVNPQDVGALGQLDTSSVKVVADEEVGPGGFIVETDANVFDHRIDAMLEKIGSELAALYESASS